MTLIQGRTHRVGTRSSRAGRSSRRFAAVATAAAMALAVSGCSDNKTYDVSPIFVMHPEKCAQYEGNVEGSGLMAHCWVTKEKCEQAVSEWRQEMVNVPDAIEFTC